jgi:hypothetical protein
LYYIATLWKSIATSWKGDNLTVPNNIILKWIFGFESLIVIALILTDGYDAIQILTTAMTTHDEEHIIAAPLATVCLLDVLYEFITLDVFVDFTHNVVVF